jgi:hypothetical protein
MRSKGKEARDGTSKGWQQGKTTRSQRQMKGERAHLSGAALAYFCKMPTVKNLKVWEHEKQGQGNERRHKQGLATRQNNKIAETNER